MFAFTRLAALMSRQASLETAGNNQDNTQKHGNPHDGVETAGYSRVKFSL
jgi:hypothetical protein